MPPTVPLPRAVFATHRRRSRQETPPSTCGHGFPRCDIRRPHPPPTISLAMGPPINIHFNHRLSGFLLAPNFSAQDRHVTRMWPATGWALLGRPEGLMGAFTVSGLMHDAGIWGLRWGTNFRTMGGFFLMGIGAALEHGFKQVSGCRVR